MTDALGRSQVLPYLAALAGRGHEITILSCEKPELLGPEQQIVRAICDEAGIEWKPIAYHRRPAVLSSLYDLARLKFEAAALHQERQFGVVHCRSYIPALVGLYLKRRFGAPFLFDMRGFWADEKREGGSWPQANPLFGTIYRYFKRREQDLLEQAGAIVSLTRAAERHIERNSPAAANVSVIPCCVDLDRFRLASREARVRAREDLGIAPHATVLCYIGSVGGNYMLPEMLRFFLALKTQRPSARFLLVTRNNPEEIRRVASDLGLDERDLIVRAANYDEVPVLASAADLGVAFKQPSFSALACSPTKLGEMLALGIPVVANAGVGDVEPLLRDTGAGVVVSSFQAPELQATAAAALQLLGDGERIRSQALQRLSLEQGVDEYDRLYRQFA